MNKSIISTVLASGLLMAVSASVYAVDTGTVNFSGKIVANTCEINVDGSNSDTSTVTFADTYTSDYGSDGAIGTSKDFTIALKKCDPLITNLNLMFTGTTTDGDNLRLENNLSGVGKATNVGITVTNNNGGSSNVVFDGSVPDASTDLANDITGASETVFSYTANVIQVGAAIPTTGQYAASASFEVYYR